MCWRKENKGVMYFNSVNVVQEEQAVIWFTLKKHAEISTTALIKH